MSDTTLSTDELDLSTEAADLVETVSSEVKEREESANDEDGKLISCPIPTVQRFGSFA